MGTFEDVFDSLTGQPSQQREIPLQRLAPTVYDPLIQKAAVKHGVDPDFVKSIIKAESEFDHSKVSKAGAIGLMQIMPNTAKGLGIDPTNIYQNIDGGTRYLAELLRKYGNKNDALAAYNGGGARYDYRGRDLSKMGKETRDYVPKVMKNYIRGF